MATDANKAKLDAAILADSKVNKGTVSTRKMRGKGVKQILPTQATVSNGVALTVPVTGTYVTKATPTVVNGVVTAIVLS